MYITQSYKYKINDVVYVSGTLPEDATLLETMNILNAKEGFNLIRKSDEEDVGNSLWLKDGDSETNYYEKEIDE